MSKIDEFNQQYSVIDVLTSIGYAPDLYDSYHWNDHGPTVSVTADARTASCFSRGIMGMNALSLFWYLTTGNVPADVPARRWPRIAEKALQQMEDGEVELAAELYEEQDKKGGVKKASARFSPTILLEHVRKDLERMPNDMEIKLHLSETEREWSKNRGLAEESMVFILKQAKPAFIGEPWIEVKQIIFPMRSIDGKLVAAIIQSLMPREQKYRFTKGGLDASFYAPLPFSPASHSTLIVTEGVWDSIALNTLRKSEHTCVLALGGVARASKVIHALLADYAARHITTPTILLAFDRDAPKANGACPGRDQAAYVIKNMTHAGIYPLLPPVSAGVKDWSEWVAKDTSAAKLYLKTAVKKEALQLAKDALLTEYEDAKRAKK